MRTLISAVMIILLCISACYVPKTIHWTDQALLHDGRVLFVKRTVRLTTRMSAGAPDLAPTNYTLEFAHPDTGKVLQWAGDYGVIPLVLEISDGIPYVVFVPEYCDIDLSKYGNPNPPYVRMKNLNGKWHQISALEFPDSLRLINLVDSYDGFWIKNGTTLSVKSIRLLNATKPQPDIAFIQSPIPTDIESWKYKYKDPSGYKLCK